jgi:phosphoglycerate dehydrogenase-like enzyme
VIGFGTIGRAVAQAFHRMGCRIGYFDPPWATRPWLMHFDARPMPLDELLTQADVVTLHVPLLGDEKPNRCTRAWQLKPTLC